VFGRKDSIQLCIEWIVRHQDADGTWGGIQPPWIYSLLALKNEGYALSHPILDRGLEALSTHWTFSRAGASYIQATESSVWDTLLTLLALHEAGYSIDRCEEMQRGVQWVLAKQATLPGDWSLTAKGVAPGGWAFERANVFYPDVDDTAVALLVLAKIRDGAEMLRDQIDESIARAVEWTLAMQSSNGGWGAFDRDNNKNIICKIPFCNFGEALDPPSVDVTAHVVEAFGALGFSIDHPAVHKAILFIQNDQETDGSWFGRWGVNHIYGTGAVLPALRSIGEDMQLPYVRRAVDWIVSKQNPDGGWGETCASYMEATLRGVGVSTPSQTAWGLMCLLAMEDGRYDASIAHGVDYLCRNQTAAGTWEEEHYTAAGFPGYGVGARTNLSAKRLNIRLHQGNELSRGFMLNFNLYRHYFPLIALARTDKWWSRSDLQVNA
jgi:squalene-hopene/tetraprenyl-beta-curcumene cyclase